MKRIRRDDTEKKNIYSVLPLVAKFFTIDDLLIISHVSKGFYETSTMDYIWKEIYCQIIKKNVFLNRPRNTSWKQAVKSIFFAYHFHSMKTNYAEKLEILSLKYNIERDLNILKEIQNLHNIEIHRSHIPSALKRKKYNEDIKTCFGNVFFQMVNTQTVESEEGKSTSYSSRYEAYGKCALAFEFTGFESDFTEVSLKLTCLQNNQVFATLASLNEDNESIIVDSRAVNYVQDVLFLNHLQIPQVISFLLVCACPINLGSFESIEKTYK